MTLIPNAPIDPNHHKGLIAADELTGEPFAVQGTASSGSINVNAIITPSGEQDVDLIKVGGSAIALGQTTMSDSLPVTIANNQSPIPVSSTNLDIRDLSASTDSISIHGDVGIVDQFDLANSNPLATAIVDANGDQISSFGGGTQYTDGAAEASPTGTVALGFDGANVRAITTDAAGDLQVDVITMPTVTVQATDLDIRDLAFSTDKVDASGSTVTANAGTNLNTSALLTTSDFNNSFGTAGSADTQVRTIQGIASMTPVQVSQATASNLNATVIGAGTAGTANAGVVTVQGIAAMTPLLVTPAANSAINIAQVNGATVNVGAGAAGSGTQRVTTSTDSTIGTVTAVTSITNSVTTTAVGTIADDSTTPGAPVMVGGSAKSPDGTDPGSVSAENDVARAITDLNRRVYVNPAHPRTLNFHSDGSSALTDTTVVSDPGDGFQIVVTSIIFSTGAATACNIFFEEGSTKVLGPWYLEAVAGRGVFWQGHKFITASTALTVTTSASIAQSLDVEYYIQAV